MIENFRVAIGNLLSNKLRTLLTMLGVTIGVAAVIILVSVGQAFETFVRDQFTGVGVNLLFVVPNFADPNRIKPLTRADVDAVSDPFLVPDALLIMPQDNVTRTIRFGNRETVSTIQGVTTAYPALFNREVVAGRFFDERELEASARVAVLESGLVDILFPDTYPIGQNIRVADVRFTVIGVMGEQGGGTFGASSGLIAPLNTVQTRLSGERILSGDRPIDFITIRASSSETVDDAVAQISARLRETRNISFRDEDDFVIFTQTEILDTLGSITALLTVFLALLASISLVVGGIGIMNIMLVTVTERTREIGLRKAVGAQRVDILLQFLTEAIILALLGGVIGVMIAFVTSLVISNLMPSLLVTIQLSSVLLATVISIAVGVVSGSYPANRAAELNPIDALRYE